MNEQPKNSSTGWMIGIILMALVVFAGAASFAGFTQNGILIKGGQAALAAGGLDCSGVAFVPSNDLGFVQDAATKYLAGDQAALIALIQVESSWNATAANPGSTAVGLGQFLFATAKDYKEFVGGTDPAGITWPSAQVYQDTSPTNHPDDARFDAKRSIYAVAQKLQFALQANSNDLKQAYINNYHGHSTQDQLDAATKAGDKLQAIYDQLKNGGGCKEVASSLVSASAFSCNNNSYTFPIATNLTVNYGTTHHNYSATDIFVLDSNKHWTEGATIVAVTNGVIRKSDYNDLGGYSVLLNGDDGLIYYFTHMQPHSNEIVKAGQRVKAGDPIGKVGQTGDAAEVGPHLHFGISDAAHTSQLEGWYPSQQLNTPSSPAAPSNKPVLDAWRNHQCLDPRS